MQFLLRTAFLAEFYAEYFYILFSRKAKNIIQTLTFLHMADKMIVRYNLIYVIKVHFSVKVCRFSHYINLFVT